MKSSHARLKVFRRVTLWCGCTFERYAILRGWQAGKHKATSARDPVVCPECGRRTWAPRGHLRSA